MITRSRRTRKISSSRLTTKSVPRRTCVACREVKDKKELLRLVRTRGGEIEIDITGKKEGRGAYLCRNRKCWESAMEGKQLEHTLKCNLSRENRDRLVENGEELLKELLSA